jgi:hypothetical protein
MTSFEIALGVEIAVFTDDEDCAHRAVASGLDDVVLRGGVGIEDHRFAVIVEKEHVGLRGDAVARADAEVAVDLDPNAVDGRELDHPFEGTPGRFGTVRARVSGGRCAMTYDEVRELFLHHLKYSGADEAKAHEIYHDDGDPGLPAVGRALPRQGQHIRPHKSTSSRAS